MDFLTMQDRVRAVIRDDQELFVTLPQVKAWLNEGAEEIAHRQGLIDAETAGVVGAGQTLTVPTGLIKIDQVWVDNENLNIEWVDNTVFSQYRDDASTPLHTIGRIFNNKVEIRPRPAVGAAYTIQYKKTPAEMVNDADVSELPAELHTKIVNYARYHAKLKEGEMSDADRYFALYEEGLSPHPLGKSRLMPGPMRIRYEAGPFDIHGSHRG